MRGFLTKPKDKLMTVQKLGLSELVLPCNDFEISGKVAALFTNGQISLNQYSDFSDRTNNEHTLPYMLYENFISFCREVKWAVQDKCSEIKQKYRDNK